MAKRAAIYKKIYLDLSKDVFYIVVANTILEGFELIQSVDKKLKEYEFPAQKQNCGAVCMPLPERGIISVFFTFNDLQAFYFCHEATHATHAVLQYIGLELNDATEEVYAYHNDMLFRHCAGFMKENKLKVKI